MRFFCGLMMTFLAAGCIAEEAPPKKLTPITTTVCRQGVRCIAVSTDDKLLGVGAYGRRSLDETSMFSIYDATSQLTIGACSMVSPWVIDVHFDAVNDAFLGVLSTEDEMLHRLDWKPTESSVYRFTVDGDARKLVGGIRDPVMCFAVSPDGTLMAVCSGASDGKVARCQIFSTEDGQQISSFSVDHIESMRVGFTNDSNRCLIVSQTPRVPNAVLGVRAVLISAHNGKVLQKQQLSTDDAPLYDLVTATTSPQALLAVGMQLLQFQFGKSSFTWKVLRPVDNLPDPRFGNEPTRIVWHEATGLVALAEIRVGSRIGTKLRFLDLQSGKILRTRIDTRDYIWDFQFSSDGRRLYGVGNDSQCGKIWLYDLMGLVHER